MFAAFCFNIRKHFKLYYSEMDTRSAIIEKSCLCDISLKKSDFTSISKEFHFNSTPGQVNTKYQISASACSLTHLYLSFKVHRVGKSTALKPTLLLRSSWHSTLGPSTLRNLLQDGVAKRFLWSYKMKTILSDSILWRFQWCNSQFWTLPAAIWV